MKPWPAIRCAARALACALALAPWAAHAEPVSYALDPHHSWVQFELSHFGTSTIRGRLGPAEGRILLDRSAGKGTVGITVPTASVSTGLSLFDWRLRRADLLAAEEHPTAWFVARELRFDGDRVAEVRGEFTLRGTSRPLTLTALRFGCFEHPVLEREVCGGDFTGRFLRSDYGMDFGLPFVGDRVTLTVQVEGVREAAPPP
ncbi:MAG: YceI family protein [Methylibium sp.]|uniref:YceI family protein n=1 Tax=Methylibium sp. TaxID=2067992 RepID=UPI00179672EC|nr:YceI family protein [Methylibium sp.]MBA2724049.1 YceI family protein [Methylibium sp.]MBA3591332.1 YceI family protein [Methylibium sp.]